MTQMSCIMRLSWKINCVFLFYFVFIVMDEKTIKEVFTLLLHNVIFPKYPFLKLHSFKGPSESVNPVCTIFYLVLTTNKELTYKEVKQIKSDVSSLFKTAGLSVYKYHGMHCSGIRTEIGDENTGKYIKHDD